MITNREFRDTLTQLLKVISPEVLAAEVDCSRANILKWADGVNLPNHIIRRQIIAFAEMKNVQ